LHSLPPFTQWLLYVYATWICRFTGLKHAQASWELKEFSGSWFVR
jgi:hypothetical protein